MPQTQTDKVVSIAPLCSLSSCWNVAIGHTKDGRKHTVKFCCEAHKLAVLSNRLKLYNMTDVTPKV